MRRGEKEMRILDTLVDPKRNSVDAGANLGVYTYWLSKLTPKVHAFEPHPAMARFLRRARLKNVELHETALSDHNGRATFTVPKLDGVHPSPGHGTLESTNATGGAMQIQVDVRKLDDVIGDADVGFMKADVEGHELALLSGAKSLIERRRPTLLIEISQETYGERPLHDVFGQIESMGYRAFYLADDGLRPARDARGQAGVDYPFNFIFRPV